jgi:hypothetical protein
MRLGSSPLRLVLFFFLSACGGNSNDCAAIVPCGSGRHYQVCNSGGADGCSFLTSDNSRFQCRSCGDCQQAMALVTAWCGSTGGATGSGGSSSLTCQSSACAGGGMEYEFCTSSTGGQCEFHAGGQTFSCRSCVDCNDAAAQVASWCGPPSSSGTTSSGTTGGGTTSGGTTGGGTTGGGTTGGGTTGGGTTGGGTTGDASCTSQVGANCYACCRQLHVEPYLGYLKYLNQCACPSCTASCTSATDVCHGGNDFLSPCSDCLKMQDASCYATADAACAADDSCAPYASCTSGCH